MEIQSKICYNIYVTIHWTVKLPFGGRLMSKIIIGG